LSSLESLGFDLFFSEQFGLLNDRELVPARVVSAGRGSYHLAGCRAPLGELRGRLLRDLSGPERPTVGDWVAVMDDLDRAIIHHVLNRRTELVRRAAGTVAGTQVIAANVDLFFIVTSANRDFNLRRLERYLAAVWDSGAEPVVVLNKIDLGGDIKGLIDEVGTVAFGVPVVKASAVTGEGLTELRQHLAPGRTVGLIGSSGVGKSSLVNRLLGREIQPVRTVRRDEKGRHATTRRELIELPDGGLLIDTPGMRELGLIDNAGGIDNLFADIATLEENCRFRDCSHQGEPGCAVVAAVESGELNEARLTSYHKLQRELAAFARRRDPAQAGRSKLRWKAINKAQREYKKINPKKKR
jgi:ribosome biogenesis GTPase